MRRVVAALAVAVAMVPALATAQTSVVSEIVGAKTATNSFYFSLRFGLNFGYMSGTESRARTGNFNAGLSATIRLADRISLVPEITLFSRKGVAELTSLSTGDPVLDPYFADPASADLALDYLDIPVVAKYQLGRFDVGAGAFVGVLLSASERLKAGLDGGGELSHKLNVEDEFRDTDYGLVFEASWTITRPRRGIGLVLHVRYQQGLSDVLESPDAPRPARTSAVQICLSFPFVR